MMKNKEQPVGTPIIVSSPEAIRSIVETAMDKRLDEFRKEEAIKDIPEYMTRSQVADYYNVGTGTVLNWEKAGKLQRVILGDSVIRYHKEEVFAIKK